MKKLIRLKGSRGARLVASAVAVAVAIAVAAGIEAAQANAASSVRAKLEHGALRITGGDASDKIIVTLKYTENRTSVISGLRRVSRPGQRTYVDAKHVPKVLGGMGTAILSTSHGVMTGHDARKAGVGGEVVAEVW